MDFQRVTEATYNIMNPATSKYAYYATRSQCEVRTQKSNVCYCPSGYSDYLCETPMPKKCYVQIT